MGPGRLSGNARHKEVFKIAENDPEASIVLEAFVCQIAKGIEGHGTGR